MANNIVNKAIENQILDLTIRIKNIRKESSSVQEKIDQYQKWLSEKREETEGLVVELNVLKDFLSRG